MAYLPGGVGQQVESGRVAFWTHTAGKRAVAVGAKQHTKTIKNIILDNILIM